MARVAIKKSVRFEVFKRDDFCCAYCGRRPPHTTLEIDHINPVANGGTNEQDNLITACFDCNRGKSDRLLSSVPVSLTVRAARIKECEDQLAAYRAMVHAQQERIESDCWEVVYAIFGDQNNSIRKDWFSSIKRFLGALDLEQLVEAGEIAGSQMNFHSDKKKFTYFCGICWNRIREAENG